jgi:hypothetical protein
VQFLSLVGLGFVAVLMVLDSISSIPVDCYGKWIKGRRILCLLPLFWLFRARAPCMLVPILDLSRGVRGGRWIRVPRLTVAFVVAAGSSRVTGAGSATGGTWSTPIPAAGNVRESLGLGAARRNVMTDNTADSVARHDAYNKGHEKIHNGQCHDSQWSPRVPRNST